MVSSGQNDLLRAAQGFLIPKQGILETESSQAYKGPSQAASVQADKESSNGSMRPSFSDRQNKLLGCSSQFRTRRDRQGAIPEQHEPFHTVILLSWAERAPT